MDFRDRASPEDHAAAVYVRGSAYFDTNFYLSTAEDSLAELDPALHYVVVGEGMGAVPSPSFSALKYERLNPDLVESRINRLFHYEAHGRLEGRNITFQSDDIYLDESRIDPGKPTVFVLLHEATYSGAPLLGWNIIGELKLTRNVVVVLLRDGDLRAPLAACASAVVALSQMPITNPSELANLAARLNAVYAPEYVIANSVETRLVGIALREEGVPLLALVHEFATHSAPHALTAFYKACDAIVFPAELVRQSSLADYPLIAQRKTYILPQGPSAIPRMEKDPLTTVEDHHEGQSDTQLDAALTVPTAPFTVLGLGTIDLRKGVDLFVAAATALKARCPDLSFRFIWLGARIHPLPNQYFTFLDEQISRSGLSGQLILADAVDDLEPVYAAADAFFLSSRLDPLPNVGIDAARKGIPLLCFKDATGFAELLEQDPVTAWLVAPHLDTGAIAEKLEILALDVERRQRAGDSVRRMARRTFNMMRYVGALDALGRASARRVARNHDQAQALMHDDAFDAKLYFGPSALTPATREAAVRRYLDETVNVNFCGGPAWGHHPRRALPGFHALLYGDLAPGFSEGVDMDPLVHFITHGRPEGPWRHDVIRLDEASLSPPSGVRSLRVAIHGHFHYTDNFVDFLEALAVNQSPFDLLLTTTSSAAADYLRNSSRLYAKGRVFIDIMSNAGRDIGPFIALMNTRLADYDVVGHLHGKRSTHTYHYDPELGNRWRHFLWQHLIGPAAPAADIVLDRFAQNPTLGMVFPENDYLVGWEQNLEFARALAPRLGLGELARHIEFPVGTMFWARTAALQRLANAQFTAADYPAEPLPIDGTMLHALERLLPTIVEASGYTFATTYFPQFTR